MENTSVLEQSLFGSNLFGETLAPRPSGPVAERFTISPFSVLDARQGVWQDRKRAWLQMGIKGETGRSAKSYNIHQWAEESEAGNRASGDGTSIFDPVLCEMAYRWFCPKGGQVLDPFAGGSVRGIVAAALGRRYWGCDLRGEQIAANNAQLAEMNLPVTPRWIAGDSMVTLDDAPRSDFLFSCPPYGDLEKYSDDPADLSAMEWHTFLAAYKRIILRATSQLRPHRFACFVVGDFRDKKGHYRNFVGETVNAFLECGLNLYNEAVLVTSVGSACLRVTKQFESGRKLAKTHQNVLIFCKGDWRLAMQEMATETPFELPV